MSSIINMKIKCTKEDCQHEWNYKGKSKFYVTCPYCYRKIRINKGVENAKRNKNKKKTKKSL